MQKEGNYMIKDYVNKTIGLSCNTKGSANEWTKNLPQYLKGTFDFSLLEIDGQKFLLLKSMNEVNLPISQVVKFSKQVRKQTGLQTLIQFKTLDSVRRRTLISNKENFIVPDKQIYIPFFRMYLNENKSIQPITDKEKLSPAAQLLLLYHLQKQSLEEMPFKDIALILKYSKKTISLVIAELQNFNICHVKVTDDRNKVLYFQAKKRALWDMVSPLMDSPVQKVWYIPKENIPAEMQLFGTYDTALAHYTFIADFSQVSYAVDKRIFIEYQEKIQEFLHPEEGNIRLEIWKYNPAILTNENFVDCLSLVLCYKDIDDERVNMEIKKMIDKIW